MKNFKKETHIEIGVETIILSTNKCPLCFEEANNLVNELGGQIPVCKAEYHNSKDQINILCDYFASYVHSEKGVFLNCYKIDEGFIKIG